MNDQQGQGQNIVNSGGDEGTPHLDELNSFIYDLFPSLSDYFTATSQAQSQTTINSGEDEGTPPLTTDTQLNSLQSSYNVNDNVDSPSFEFNAQSNEQNQQDSMNSFRYYHIEAHPQNQIQQNPSKQLFQPSSAEGCQRNITTLYSNAENRGSTYCANDYEKSKSGYLFIIIGVPLIHINVYINLNYKRKVQLGTGNFRIVFIPFGTT
jgi:hypothetical protein